MSGDTVLLRAASGARIGMGHAVRTLAVAGELRRRGARPVLVVDDPETASRFAARGFQTLVAGKHPDWSSRPARVAWFDGFWDWSPEMAELKERGIPCVLIENRTQARELADALIYPALHHRPDAWDREHPRRVFAGPRWIPLAPEVRAASPQPERDVELLVTFGGSDPLRSTERVLRLLSPSVGPVVVAVGVHMRERLTSIRTAASHLRTVRILPVGSRLAGWMARARHGLTAVGTTLYEMAHLELSAMILANYEGDTEALEHYRARGPHRVLGVAARLDDDELEARLAVELVAGPRPFEPIPALGAGAGALAELLLEMPATLDGRVQP